MDEIVLALLGALASGFAGLANAYLSRWKERRVAPAPEALPGIATRTLLALWTLTEASSADLAVSTRQTPGEVLEALEQLNRYGLAELLEAPDPLAAARVTRQGAKVATGLASAGLRERLEGTRETSVAPEDLDAAIDRAIARLNAGPASAS
jgi:hypothetical protein